MDVPGGDVFSRLGRFKFYPHALKRDLLSPPNGPRPEKIGLGELGPVYLSKRLPIDAVLGSDDAE